MPYWHPLVKEVKLVLLPVLCPRCHSDHIMKGGKTKAGIQRYKCLNVNCPYYSFQLDLIYKGRSPEIKEHIVDMALNGSGIRDAVSTKPRSSRDVSRLRSFGKVPFWLCRNSHLRR